MEKEIEGSLLNGKMQKAYRVGALLYIPAVYDLSVVDKIARGDFKSVAFCLEDSIADDAVEQAEINLKRILTAIKERKIANLPMIFIRPRSPKHLERVHNAIMGQIDIVSGYVLPKFDMSNANEYKAIFLEINKQSQTPLYMMPILESRLIAQKSTRTEELYQIKAVLDSISEYVLNVRVGGNDFCNLFGIRRRVNQTVYDAGVVRDILIDILNVFSLDYVVSGPVWEYYGKDENGDWAKGLKRELELDLLNGFVGKTSIHPEQIPIIYKSLRVDKNDYQDALSILGWHSSRLGVFSSANHSRMNEVKCHRKWAERIFILASIYGIKE
ncbi:MAG: HpcH/HpaI aldolase/citrate lyase family protein [Clostridia bacterium]|nr:HpcH/HpaI aldolase/citrate lyase family protein [Clostridia bacterium]